MSTLTKGDEMKTQAKYTETPWKQEGVRIYDDKEWQIGSMNGLSPSSANIANASFVVKAVNSHEALVEACKEALLLIQHDIVSFPMRKTNRPDIEAQLRQALKQVEGE